MLELVLLIGIAGVVFYFREHFPSIAEEPTPEPVPDPALEREQEIKRESEKVLLEKYAVQCFIDEIKTTTLPDDLRSIIISKFRSHHEWDATRSIDTSNLEGARSRLRVEAETKVRRLLKQVRDYLPPVPMIAVGGRKTWSSYSNDFWYAFEEPKHFNNEFFSWGNWHRANYDVGTKFNNSLHDIPITVKLPDRSRIGGQMIMAPPDHGKTTYMEGMIMDDVRSGAAVIVMDSQQGMLERLLPALPEDRLVYLDAGELTHPLALSAFNLGRTDRIEDEVKISRALDMFENLFSSMEFSFTANQSTLFRELCRFLVAIPNVSLSTAVDILRNGYHPYAQFLHLVPEDTVSFVTTHLGPTTKRDKQGDYGPTRREVERRLISLGRIPAITRMFNAPTRKVDFADALNKQKLILINTAHDRISPSGASFFGRYCLMQIALEVLARPETHDPMRRVHFYIDEAQEYFSSADLLSLLMEQGRKRGLCLVMAFHHFGQLNKAAAGLSDTVRALTAIKCIKASNGADARAIAGDIQADPSKLLNIRKHHFYTHVRDIGSAVLWVPNSKEKLKPRRTPSEVKALKRRMLNRYSYDPSNPKPSIGKPSKPPHPPKPDIDLHGEQSLD